MKSLFVVILTCLGCIIQAQEFIQCLSVAPLDSYRPLERLSAPRENIEIPIVFHVVYRNEEENISDELILEQISILNEDYNAQNSDLSNVPDEFQNDIGNPGISFCLATVNPENQAETGIIRKPTQIENIGNASSSQNGLRSIKTSLLGGSDPWDTERYLNVWIGSRNDNGLGDATFPIEEDPNKVDGVVISHKVFREMESGIGKFHLGRTLTHEIGHYLNVLHLNGNESSCFNEGDFVDDTPQQLESYFGDCDGKVESCDSRDMDTNFMNFRNDNCLNYFTKGQVDRMINTLFTTRFKLISSLTCSENFPIPKDPLEVALFSTLKNKIEFSLITLQNREYLLYVYDSTGRYIRTITPNPTHLYDLQYAHFPTGIYFVQLIVGGKKFVRKVFLP